VPLTTCADCQAEVSTSAKACPRCGRPVSKPAFTKPKNTKRFVALISILALLVVISLSTTERTSPPEDPTVSQTFGAMESCQRFVLERLKAPSNAKFEDALSEKVVTPVGGGEYVVKSFVDAQNSFGATLRSRYTCSVKDEGNSWSLRSLQLE
jgi:hypothetical protein